MDIMELDRKDRKKAAALLAQSFFDYPVFTFYFPDVQRRTWGLPLFMDGVLKCALHYGSVYTTADMGGVLFTLPDEHSAISDWEYIRQGFLKIPWIMGWQNFNNMNDCEAYVKQMHDELMQGHPHEYIWGLAVAPAKQAQGVGSALLRRALLCAAEQKKGVYLETHLEKNIAYYERYGFRLLRTATIPKHGLQMWCMFWDAQEIGKISE